MRVCYNSCVEVRAVSTEAEKRAVKKYQATRDNIMIRISKEDGAAVRQAAAAAGLSVQGYILQAVRERMEREGSNGNA